MLICIDKLAQTMRLFEAQFVLNISSDIKYHSFASFDRFEMNKLSENPIRHRKGAGRVPTNSCFPCNTFR